MDETIRRQVVLDALDEIETEVAEGRGFQYSKWRQYFAELPSAQSSISVENENDLQQSCNKVATDDINIQEPDVIYSHCEDCIHTGDSEDICILRLCKYAIAELKDCYEPKQPEQRWIQCSERLPDTDRNVFIARGTPESMTVCVGHYRHDYDQWYEDRNWFAKCLYDGLYWCEMPSLPEPYKEDEQG